MPLRLLAALWPWLVFPLVTLWRARGSRTLDEVPALPPPPLPTVSVVIPARDEAANIERVVRSVLATAYPALDLVVVDDHSEDGTGALARAVAPDDPRLRVVDAPVLPPGWMGKQWACATGARATSGEILLFTDADTTHAPDLVGRAVAELRGRRVALLSVAGEQALHSFWERVVQPHVLTVLLGRYGSTERVTRSRNARDKIANGQCLFVERAVYDALGGHEAVRDNVAEDLMLAQRTFGAGYEVAIVAGPRQLSTRMYTSLGTLVRGWRKNVYAGGREAMPFGALGRAIFPLLLLVPALYSLVPVVLLALALAGVLSAFTLLWTTIATGLLLLWWALVYARLGLSPLWALSFPLGAGVLLWIVIQAIARGRRVEWKGRGYVSR